MNHHSISAFFPCYNDKSAIATMVAEAHSVLEKITDDFEVIVVDDGSTDGDARYDVKELPKLYEKLTDEVDIVNGFKIKRHDPWYRVIIGFIDQKLMKLAFSLKIKDVDCDFRIISLASWRRYL